MKQKTMITPSSTKSRKSFPMLNTYCLLLPETVLSGSKLGFFLRNSSRFTSSALIFLTLLATLSAPSEIFAPAAWSSAFALLSTGDFFLLFLFCLFCLFRAFIICKNRRNDSLVISRGYRCIGVRISNNRFRRKCIIF